MTTHICKRANPNEAAICANGGVCKHPTAFACKSAPTEAAVRTLFSAQMVDECIASVLEMDDAKRYGRKIVIASPEGAVTAYSWQGALYVVSVEITPETIR